MTEENFENDIYAKTSGLGIGEVGKFRDSMLPNTIEEIEAYIAACEQRERYMQKREASLSDGCWYCGQPAVGFGIFDEPVCRECGGR